MWIYTPKKIVLPLRYGPAKTNGVESDIRKGLFFRIEPQGFFLNRKNFFTQLKPKYVANLFQWGAHWK
jgi:hypothetical protein